MKIKIFNLVIIVGLFLKGQKWKVIVKNIKLIKEILLGLVV